MNPKKIDRWCLHAKAVHKPDVVDIRFAFSRDHTDEPCVNFTIIVSDEIAKEASIFRRRAENGGVWETSRLYQVSKAVMGLLRSKIDFEGYHVYSDVRSNSEDRKLEAMAS
jgi:hypothetical protein